MSQLKSLRFLYIVFAVPLLLSLGLALLSSWRWPLVGDATLIHYVVFLMEKGLTPYRDILDINLPGSYFFEAIEMRLFGMGATAWRLYDLLLLASIAGAAILIAGRRNVFPGILAGALFSLIHIQDGLAQLGQRDLLIAALLLWSYVALFNAQRGANSGCWVFLFGLLAGTTFTIKPVFIPLAILLLLISAQSLHKSGGNLVRYYFTGLLGVILPGSIVALWLYRSGALLSFVKLGATLIPFHASLGHQSLSFLLAHVTSPIMPLCAAWLILMFLIRPRLTTERIELLIGIACAILAYIVQGKGFSYHRYAFLAFMLLVMMMDFTDALRKDRLPQLLAILALAFSCFVTAPRAAWLVRSFRPETPFQESLSKQLISLGPRVSNKVQCLDTFGGCINTLYNLRLVQSTGYLYDCYLFTSRQNEITRNYRRDFFEAYRKAQPEVIVLTDQLCFGDQGGFQKIETWPELQTDIARNYSLTKEWKSSVDQRWWSHSEAPPAYRIYLRK